MKTKFAFLLAFSVVCLNLFSQENSENSINCSIGTDVASSYLWRGFPQGTGPAVQPWGEVSYKGFALGTWGSYEFTGVFKEIDIYAKYTYKSFSLLFTDLFFPDYPGLDQDYFNFKDGTTGHAAELGVSFNGTEKLPFSVYAGVMLYGKAIDPDPDDAAKLNHSAYLEVNYFWSSNDISYNAFAGLTPTAGSLYTTSGFSVFNLGVGAKKTIQITESFSIPLKLTLAMNTVTRKLHAAAVISF